MFLIGCWPIISKTFTFKVKVFTSVECCWVVNAHMCSIETTLTWKYASFCYDKKHYRSVRECTLRGVNNKFSFIADKIIF